MEMPTGGDGSSSSRPWNAIANGGGYPEGAAGTVGRPSNPDKNPAKTWEEMVGSGSSSSQPKATAKSRESSPEFEDDAWSQGVINSLYRESSPEYEEEYDQGALDPASASVYRPTAEQKRMEEDLTHRQLMVARDLETRQRRRENHERSNSLLYHSTLEREMAEMFRRNPINNPYDPRRDNRNSILADLFTEGAAKRTKFNVKNPYTLELDFSKLTL